LNELPPEFDFDFLDEVGTNPFYCTQLAFRVVRSQFDEQSPSHQSQNDVVATILAGSSTQNANACSVNNQESSVVAGVVVQDVEKEGLADIVKDAVQDVEKEGLADIVKDALQDEIWLTSPIPYTSKTFGTIKEARGFYNSYAQRVGFSIRTSTTCLS